MRYYLILSLFTLMLAACQQTPPAAEQAQTPPPAAAQPAPVAATLPSVPLELLQKIFDEGTQVEIAFFPPYDFTMSLPDKPSIQHGVSQIAAEPAPIKPECPAVGNITYVIKGDVVLQGMIYFSKGCTYFVFSKDGKPAYANYMTDAGIEFFNKNIQSALERRKQLEQGGGQ